MCPGGFIFLTTIGSCLYSFLSKIKEILGITVKSNATSDSHNNTNNDNDNDNNNNNDNDNDNNNLSNSTATNTNNIMVKPIININLDEIAHTTTTNNDIIKELIKLEEKKVETVRRMYSLQAKTFECPKCKTKIILQEKNTQSTFLFPDSLIPSENKNICYY